MLAATVNAGSTKYIKIVRAGSTFSAAYSGNGSTWTSLGSAVTISMSNTVAAGLWAASDVSSTMGAATFTNVQIVAAPTVVTSSYDSGSSSLAVQFSSDISASLTVSDLSLSNLTWLAQRCQLANIDTTFT